MVSLAARNIGYVSFTFTMRARRCAHYCVVASVGCDTCFGFTRAQTPTQMRGVLVPNETGPCNTVCSLLNTLRQSIATACSAVSSATPSGGARVISKRSPGRVSGLSPPAPAMPRMSRKLLVLVVVTVVDIARLALIRRLDSPSLSVTGFIHNDGRPEEEHVRLVSCQLGVSHVKRLGAGHDSTHAAWPCC